MNDLILERLTYQANSHSHLSKDGPALPPPFNWDLALNGEIWECERGDSYRCSSEKFLQRAKKQAKLRGLKLRFEMVEDCVVLQAFGGGK